MKKYFFTISFLFVLILALPVNVWAADSAPAFPDQDTDLIDPSTDTVSDSIFSEDFETDQTAGKTTVTTTAVEEDAEDIAEETTTTETPTTVMADTQSGPADGLKIAAFTFLLFIALANIWRSYKITKRRKY